jgi:hypothetical protein
MNAPICHLISNNTNSTTIYKISKQASVPYICLKDKYCKQHKGPNYQVDEVPETKKVDI